MKTNRARSRNFWLYLLANSASQKLKEIWELLSFLHLSPSKIAISIWKRSLPIRFKFFFFYSHLNWFIITSLDFWKNCMNGFLYFFAKEKQMQKMPEDYLFEKLLKRYLIEERGSKERTVIEKCSKLSDYFKYSQKTFTHALEYIDSFKSDCQISIYQIFWIYLGDQYGFR